MVPIWFQSGDQSGSIWVNLGQSGDHSGSNLGPTVASPSHSGYHLVWFFRVGTVVRPWGLILVPIWVTVRHGGYDGYGGYGGYGGAGPSGMIIIFWADGKDPLANITTQKNCELVMHV